MAAFSSVQVRGASIGKPRAARYRQSRTPPWQTTAMVAPGWACARRSRDPNRRHGGALRQLGGRLAGALQITGVQGVQRGIGQGPGDVTRLCKTGVVEANVFLPLVATGAVPRSFSVANGNQLRQGHGGGLRQSEYGAIVPTAPPRRPINCCDASHHACGLTREAPLRYARVSPCVRRFAAATKWRNPRCAPPGHRGCHSSPAWIFPIWLSRKGPWAWSMTMKRAATCAKRPWP